MEYPIVIDLDVTQDDFIGVELLELTIEKDDFRKDTKSIFLIRTAIAAAILLFAVFVRIKGLVVWQACLLVPAFWLIYLYDFLYNYYKGYKKEYDFAVQHIMTSRNEHTFFRPEKGKVTLSKNSGEYRTDEQNRFFNYDLIKHIKITRHLFIFVMKESKDKNLAGFQYMVIPKRNITDEQYPQFMQFVEKLTADYGITEWTDSKVIG